MAKRKSLNRRSGRFSRGGSIESGFLDPDTRIIDDDENPLWWKNLEDTRRRSTLFNVAEETGPLLDPASRVDSTGDKGEWWKMLETTNGRRSTARNSMRQDNDESSPESESIKQTIHKRKVPLRGTSRDSQNSNAFISVLDNTSDSTASNENAAPKAGRSSKNSGIQGKRSHSVDNIRKMKPKLATKRKFSKSRNVFEDILLEDESLKQQLLRPADGEQDSDDNSLILGQRQASLMRLSFMSNDTESVFARNPKAQSTMLDINMSERSSDTSITDRNVYKQKPRWLRRNLPSAQSNNFSLVLESGDNLEEAPHSKSNASVKDQSVPVEALPAIPSTNTRTSPAVSNEKSSASQKRQLRSISLDPIGEAQSDSGESDDTTVSESKAYAPYKPKSKFLRNWRMNEEAEPQEVPGNESDESVPNQLQQPDEKNSKAAASHLQNSASFSRLNNLSARSKKSLNKSQNNSKHLKQMTRKSSARLKNAMSESEDDPENSPEESRSKVAQEKEVDNKTRMSKLTATDSSEDEDQEQNPSPHKSFSQRISQTKTTTLTKESRLNEDDRVIEQSTRVSVQSTKTTSRVDSIIEDASDEEEGDNVEESAHNKSSRSAASHLVSKGSRITIAALSEDDDEEDEAKRSTSRGAINKSPSKAAAAFEDEDEADKAVKRSTSRGTINKSPSKSATAFEDEDEDDPANNEVPDGNISDYIDPNHPVPESLKSKLILAQSIIARTNDFSEEDVSSDLGDQAGAHNRSVNNTRRKIIFVGDDEDDEDEDGTETIQLAMSTTSRSDTEARSKTSKGDSTSKIVLVRASENYANDKSDDDYGSSRKESGLVRESTKRKSKQPISPPRLSRSRASKDMSDKSDDERELGSTREEESNSIPRISRSRASRNNVRDDSDDEAHATSSKSVRKSNRGSQVETASNVSSPDSSQSRASRNNVRDDSDDEPQAIPSKSVRKSSNRSSQVETRSNLSSPNSSRSRATLNKSGSSKSSTRNVSISKVRLAALIDDHLDNQSEASARRKRRNLKENTTIEETLNSRSTNTTKAKSIVVEECRTAADVRNADRTDAPTILSIISEPHTSTPLATASKRRLEIPSDIENPTEEIIKKVRLLGPDVQTIQETELPQVSITSNDDETAEQYQIRDKKNIDRKSARTSNRKTLESSARNRTTEKQATKQNTKNLQILQDDSEEEEEDQVPENKDIDRRSARTSSRKTLESSARNRTTEKQATKQNTKNLQILQDDSEEEEEDQVPENKDIDRKSARTSNRKTLESARNRSTEKQATKQNTKNAQIFQDDSEEEEEEDQVPDNEAIDQRSGRTSNRKTLESSSRNRTTEKQATKQSTKNAQIFQDDSEEEEEDQVPDNENVNSKSGRTSNRKTLESSRNRTTDKQATKQSTKNAQIFQDDSEEEEEEEEDQFPDNENVNSKSGRTSNRNTLESSTRNRTTEKQATKQNTKNVQISQDDSEEEEEEEEGDQVPDNENVNSKSGRTSNRKTLESSSRNRTTEKQATKQHRKNAQIFQDDSEEEEEDQAPDNEAIDRRSARTSNRKTLESSSRNRTTEKPATKNNTKTTRITEEDSEEEHETLQRSRVTPRNSPRKTDQIRDMSSMNLSKGRSPLMSSTQRSIITNAGKKRSSKLPLRLSTHLDTDVPVAESTRISRHPLLKTTSISPSDDETEEHEPPETSKRQKVPEPQQKKLTDGPRKKSITFKETGHHPLRITNTIPEESSMINNESPHKASNLDSQQFAMPNSRLSIAKRLLDTTHKGVQTSISLNKTKEKSQIVTKTPVKRVTVAGPSAKMSKLNVGGTQRSMLDFLKGNAQEALSRILSSQPSQHPASQALTNTSTNEELKKEIEKIAGIREAEPKKKPDSSAPLAKKAPTRKKLTPPKPKKPVHSAYLINGRVYKPPRLERPKRWVTNRLYQFLEKCLKPKYDMSTRVRSEKFIRHLAKVVDFAAKKKKYENYRDELEDLMMEMARLNIIKNRGDFYQFCFNFLPYEIRVKFTPMMLPGNQMSIPFDPDQFYTPLLEAE